MSREFLLKTANVFEKLAEYFDQEETRQQTQIKAAQVKIAEELGKKISDKTGDTLPSDLLTKIATDEHLAEIFAKLAAQDEKEPEGLGEASDIRDNNTSSANSYKEQIKEASMNADDQFLNWIMA